MPVGKETDSCYESTHEGIETYISDPGFQVSVVVISSTARVKLKQKIFLKKDLIFNMCSY